MSKLAQLAAIECLLCQYPMMDGGHELRNLNVKRFANWWLAERGTPFDEEILTYEPLICVFCTWKAR
jgi:hypothetical protein